MSKLAIAFIVALVALTGVVSAIGNGPNPTTAANIAGALTAAGYENDVQMRAGALGYNVVTLDTAENPGPVLAYTIGVVAIGMVDDGDADAYSQVGVVSRDSGVYTLYAVALNGEMANQLVFLAKTNPAGATTYVDGILAGADSTELDGLPESLGGFGL